jgi:OmpA-like transmembrane domain
MNRNPRHLRNLFSLTGACALALCSSGVSAQGWLAGGSVGTVTQSGYSVGGPIATLDDSDGGTRAFGGYMFNPMQGVVVSFVDLGTMYYAGPAWGNFNDYLKADGVDISYIIGFTPGNQERAALFGTVGAISWDQSVNYTENLGTTNDNYRYSDSGTSMSVGFGTDVNFSAGGTSAWGFHFVYQLFMDVGDKNNSGHQYDRYLFSAGIDYRFGKSGNN